MKTILQIVRNVPAHWVGDGFPVRSLFSYHDSSDFDPFLLLDYAGPHTFAPAEARRGVGEHPHRGFETVTIVYQGEVEHGDSSGAHGSIGPGDVQWMTAASGLVHEEFHSERFAREGGTLEMVQLWVNLLARDKKSPPKYQEILAKNIPTVHLPGSSGRARVIAGDLNGTRGPASTFTPINAWDLRLPADSDTTLTVPEGHTSLLIVQQGQVQVNETELLQGVELARFDRSGTQIKLQAKEETQALLLTGEPLREPVAARGPFVMNTQEEIREAIGDYQAGKMGRLR